MGVNKVTVNQNTMKFPKYTEKKMMLYIHKKIQYDIFPSSQSKECWLV